MKENNVSGAVFWKILERFGVQASQFVLQLILARILDPEHYGVLSLMTVFTALATVFIQNGFNTALIQNKDVTEEDYSSVFWVTLGVAAVLYGLIFLAAPVIAAFYEMPSIVLPLRVLALMLFPGAMNSVQLARVSREMDFKKVFMSNLAGMIVAGVTGIAIALLGGGLWALVVQTMLNVIVVCIVMFFTVRWRPRLVCNLARVRVLFGYGWKLLVSGLMDTLYQDIRSMVIGKLYDSETLGHYNRGKNFPQFIVTAVNNTAQSVMLPAMSAKQDEPAQVKALLKSSVSVCSYILFPLMAGLAGVATPLVRILLTEKWLPCVPYMQIYCFTLAFNPVHSCNLQAVNAMGRSDIFLKLEIIKDSIGIALLALAAICFDSPIAIAVTGAFASVINCFVNAAPNRKLIDYSWFAQMKDMLPSLFLYLGMLGCVLAVQLLGLNDYLTIALQVLVGVAVYLLASLAVRPKPFLFLLEMLRGRIQKRK